MTFETRHPAGARRVVVITGASAGVGRATAQLFARTGACLGLIARDAIALEQTKSEVLSLGAEAHAVACDVAEANAVFEAAEIIVRELGPIDVWINNAMLTVFSPVVEITPEEFRRVTEVTYLGYVHGTMAALREMRARDHGTIVQVGSALAYRSIPLQAAYCGAKHAILGFTDALRSELIHDRRNIRLTMVHLPAINTPQFDWARTRLAHEPRPVPPVLQPETAARAILLASQEARREYWLGLSTVKAILGDMAAPGLLDRYLAWRGYPGQQRPAAVQPDRRDNLYEPVPDLHRTRGSFEAEAHAHAFVWPADWARLAAVGLAILLVGAVLALLVQSCGFLTRWLGAA